MSASISATARSSHPRSPMRRWTNSASRPSGAVIVVVKASDVMIASGLIMRTPLLIAFALLGTAPAWAAEEPSGCDKFKWPIEHERAALTAPDRAKLASGARAGRVAANGHDAGAASRRPRPSCPTPPERAPKEGTFAGFAQLQGCTEGRPLHGQPVRRRLGRRGPGRTLPQAQGLQRRHRLRRHPQDHEVRAFGEPVRTAGQRHQARMPVSIAILPSE